MRNTIVRTNVPLDRQIREVLNSTMASLGLVAQSVVNAADFPNERAKAIFYVRAVTGIVYRASQMMVELNRIGVEKIRMEFRIEDKEISPKNPGFIV